MSTAIAEVTFSALGERRWVNNDSAEYKRIRDLRARLSRLADLWNAMTVGIDIPNAGADRVPGNDARVTNAYRALQASKIKIVDLIDLEPEDRVFLGGSRRKRQSKKRKNHKKHNNNQ